MAETYLDKSEYPIDDPNMQLKLPGTKEEAGAEIAPSQVEPSPGENTAAPAEITAPPDENQFSIKPKTQHTNPSQVTSGGVNIQKAFIGKLTKNLQDTMNRKLIEKGELDDDDMDYFAEAANKLTKIYNSIGSDEYKNLQQNHKFGDDVLSRERAANAEILKILDLNKTPDRYMEITKNILNEDPAARDWTLYHISNKIASIGLSPEDHKVTTRYLMNFLMTGDEKSLAEAHFAAGIHEDEVARGVNLLSASFLNPDWGKLLDATSGKRLFNLHPKAVANETMWDEIASFSRGETSIFDVAAGFVGLPGGIREFSVMLDRMIADPQELEKYLQTFPEEDREEWREYYLDPKNRSHIRENTAAILQPIVNTFNEFGTPVGLTFLGAMWKRRQLVAMAGRWAGGVISGPAQVLISDLGLASFGAHMVFDGMRHQRNFDPYNEDGSMKRSGQFTQEIVGNLIHSSMGILMGKHATSRYRKVKVSVTDKAGDTHLYKMDADYNPYKVAHGYFFEPGTLKMNDPIASQLGYLNQWAALGIIDRNAYIKEMDIWQKKNFKDGEGPFKDGDAAGKMYDAIMNPMTTESVGITLGQIGKKIGRDNFEAEVANISKIPAKSLENKAHKEMQELENVLNSTKNEIKTAEEALKTEGGDTWQNRTDLQNSKQRLNELETSSKEVRNRVKEENLLNKEIKQENIDNNAGEYRITSKANVEPQDGRAWKSLRFNPKTREFHVEWLGEKVKVLDSGEITYHGPAREGFSIPEGTPYAESGHSVFGGKLNKVLSNQINTFINRSELNFKSGETITGKNGETFMFINDKIGWRNLEQDGLNKDATLSMWFAESLNSKSKMYTTPKSEGAQFLDWMNNRYEKFGKWMKDVESKIKGKFEQPDSKIYTYKPNKKVGQSRDKYITQSRANGLNVGPRFKPVESVPSEAIIIQQKIADKYNKMKIKNDHLNPDVKASAKAFHNECVAQYDRLIEDGFIFKYYRGKGQPYKNSRHMMKRLDETGENAIFPTSKGFGPWQGETNINVNTFLTMQLGKNIYLKKGGNEKAVNPDGTFHPEIVKHFPMLAPSGRFTKSGKSILLNDVFRWVHDILGHAERGNSFGIQGETAAYLAHSEMFSDAAVDILFTQTVGPNAYYNFGGKKQYAPERTYIDRDTRIAFESQFHLPGISNSQGKYQFFNNKQDAKDYIKTAVGNLVGGGFNAEAPNFIVIANKTSKKNVDLHLGRLGDKYIEGELTFFGKDVKKWLKDGKELNENQLKERNRGLLNKLVEDAAKDGREIIFQESMGHGSGKTESGFTISGDITQTEASKLGIMFGQESIASNGGIINMTNGNINHATGVKFSPTGKGFKDKDYTEVKLGDGRSVFFRLDLAKRRTDSYLMMESNKFDKFNLSQANRFYDEKDRASWEELFGFGAKFAQDPVHTGTKGSYIDYKSIADNAIKDGYMVIDFNNAKDPAWGNIISTLHNNNGEVKFRFWDNESNKYQEQSIKYFVDEASFTEAEAAFILNLKTNDGVIYDGRYRKLPIEAWEGQSSINPENPSFFSQARGERKKLIKLEEHKTIDGDPIIPNKGLGKNHLANVNLDKFPPESRPILRSILDAVGNKQVSEWAGYRGFQESISFAVQPKNISLFLEKALIQGEGNVFLSNGKVNPMLRINDIDVVTSKIVLKTALDAFIKNPNKTNRAYVQHLTKAAMVINEVSGRTLGSQKIEINGVNTSLNAALELGDGELLLLNNLIRGEQNPVTLMDKIVELRRNMLLASGSSIVRSLAGNSINFGLVAGPEKILSGIQGEIFKWGEQIIREGKWKPLENRQLMDALHFGEGFTINFKSGLKTAYDILIKEDPIAMAESALAKREFFHQGAIEGGVGKVARVPQRIQMALDVMFRKPAEGGFMHEFAGRQARSEGLKGEAYRDRVKELLEDPKFGQSIIFQKWAAKEAEYITFQAELGKLGSIINRMRTGKGTEATQLIIPFFNTAVNLLKVSIDHTPFRAATPTYFKAFHKGVTNAEWGRFHDLNSRMTTGTGIMWMFMKAMNDNTSYEGSWADLDADQRLLKEGLGYQPNSINFKNEDGSITSFSTLGYEPLASLFSIAGALHNAKGDGMEDQFVSALSELINQFRNNPFMQGIDDFVGMFEGKEDPMSFVVRLAMGTVAPNILMQGGKIKDDIRYEPHYSDELFSDVFKVEEWYNRATQNFGYILGPDDVPKVDIFGRPVRVGDPGGALYAMRIKETEKDPEYTEISKEFLRLSPQLSELTFEKDSYGDIELTDKQNFMLKVSAGENFHDMMKTHMLDEGGNLKESWTNMGDKSKILMIQKVKDAVSKMQMFALMPELVMQGTQKVGIGLPGLSIAGEDFMIRKEGREELETRDEIKKLITKIYRTSEAGGIEIEKAEQLANEVITLMRKGEDMKSAVEQITSKNKGVK